MTHLLLTREVMGALALGVVWVNALLVAGAALQDLREVWALRRRAKRAWRGVVESGDGDGGVLASWTVRQRGRALDAKAPAIAFHDREFESKIFGGSVRVGNERKRLEGPGELWVTAEARAAATACGDRSTFDAAYAQATRAAGFQREVSVAIKAGDDVCVLEATGTEPLVVATFDATAHLGRGAALIAAFIPLELLACALATAVALAPPHFGTVSTVGAMLLLGFYLGVTPIAVGLRDRVRRPSDTAVRGSWSIEGLPAA